MTPVEGSRTLAVDTSRDVPVAQLDRALASGAENGVPEPTRTAKDEKAQIGPEMGLNLFPGHFHFSRVMPIVVHRKTRFATDLA